MKKICLFLALILLLGCFAGCQSAKELSSSQKNAIADSWNRQTNMGSFPGWYDQENGHPYGLAYYGTANGYSILMYNTGTSMGEHVISIEEYDFKLVEIFRLYAYKNGNFTALEDAYKEGRISKTAIASTFKAHKEFVCATNPQMAELWGYK